MDGLLNLLVNPSGQRVGRQGRAVVVADVERGALRNALDPANHRTEVTLECRPNSTAERAQGVRVPVVDRVDVVSLQRRRRL